MYILHTYKYIICNVNVKYICVYTRIKIYKYLLCRLDQKKFLLGKKEIYQEKKERFIRHSRSHKYKKKNDNTHTHNTKE